MPTLSKPSNKQLLEEYTKTVLRWESSVNAVKHIFISQMKSTEQMCASSTINEDRHEFNFSLRSLQDKPKHKLDIVLDFSPLNNTPGPSSQSQKMADSTILAASLLLPSFSKGSETKYHAFASVSDEIGFQTENKKIVQELTEKSEARVRQNSVIMEARPRSNYCQICKETFSDYLQHLQHWVHVKKFQDQTKSKILDGLIKTVDKDSTSSKRSRPFSEEEEELISFPSKMRVMQMQNTLTPMRVSAIEGENSKVCNKLSDKVKV